MSKHDLLAVVNADKFYVTVRPKSSAAVGANRHYIGPSADRRYYKVNPETHYVWVKNVPWPGYSSLPFVKLSWHRDFFRVNTWGYQHYKHTAKNNPNCQCQMQAVMD